MAIETNYSPDQSTQSGQADQAKAIGNPGGSIQEAMEASRTRLTSAYNALQERSNQVLHGAEGYIQNRPLQAVIYAASIGAVLGLVAGLMLGGATERESPWYRRWL
ncbi:MAG TPA: hypothetical protein VFB75_02675 [Burkholderiales bacterium]|nr:hypothetical protein [Burkholderiales bacterium]